MGNHFICQLKDAIKNKNECYLTISYEEFQSNYEKIIELCGKTGVLMISEKNGVLCLDDVNFIKIRIAHKKNLTCNHFWFLEKLKGIEIIGSPETRKSFGKLIISDVKRMKILLIFVSAVYFILFLSAGSSMEKLNGFINTLITVCSIFIATIFVFIGMFYGDKSRSKDMYKNGYFDNEYNTDVYIITLSFVSLLILIIAYGLSCIDLVYYKNSYINTFLKKINIVSEYGICLALTYIAIIFLIICFDSLINYYLKTCRNEAFVDAVNEKVEERQKK